LRGRNVHKERRVCLVDGLLEYGRASGITTASYSEPVVDGLFTMEGNKKRSPS
jgi:hypothetical protein